MADGHHIAHDNAYSLLGGEDGVDRVVSNLYAKLVLDPQFGPIFMAPALDSGRLLKHQREFIRMAMGGPCKETLADMRAACAALADDFCLDGGLCQIMTGHLRQTLTDMQVPADCIDHVISVVEDVTMHEFNA